MMHLNSPQSLCADSREMGDEPTEEWAKLPVRDCRVFVSSQRDVWVSGFNPWLTAAMTENGLIGDRSPPLPTFAATRIFRLTRFRS